MKTFIKRYKTPFIILMNIVIVHFILKLLSAKSDILVFLAILLIVLAIVTNIELYRKFNNKNKNN